MGWKEDLGQEIRDARTAAGQTQARLANVLHMHENNIGRYERGESVPSIEVLTAIALALGKRYFTVRGIRVGFDGNGTGLGPQVVPQQLNLQFDETGAVTIKIRPSGTHLAIIEERRSAGSPMN